MSGLVASTILEIPQDLDEDRYFDYDQFKQVLNFLPMFSKMQAFCLYMGITGFRPIECCRARIGNLLFDNRECPMVQNLITKVKPKAYYDKNGKLLTVLYTKKKKRVIPLWVRDYFEEYIRRNWQVMSGEFLFPNGRGGHMSSRTMVVLFDKLRKKMIKADSLKYSWVMDIVGSQFNPSCVGNVQNIHRLSMYSFRKMRVTIYALACLEKGIQDVLLCTAQFIGHGSNSIRHTFRYVKRLISERVDGAVIPLKAPDLNENILGVDGPTNEIDRIITLLSQSPEVRNTIATFLSKQRNKN